MSAAKSRAKQVDLKIILLGASNAGKTSIVVRHTQNEFEATTATIGASFSLKVWRQKYNIGIWDTAGQEKYDALSSYYTRGSGAAVIVYDVTDQESFDAIGKYVKLLNDNVPDCYKVLVGAKVDLVDEGVRDRRITKEQGLQMAQSLNSAFLETSSKTGYNVSEVFERICCQHFRETPEEGAPASPSATTKPAATVPTNTIRVEDSSDGHTQPPAKSSPCC